MAIDRRSTFGVPRQRHPTQPPSLWQAELNLNHHLTNGLKGAWYLGNGYPQDFVNGANGTNVGSIPTVNTTQGPAPSFTGSTTQYLDVPYSSVPWVSSLSAFSASIWYQWNGTRQASPNDWGTLFCSGDFIGGNFSVIINKATGGTTQEVRLYVDGTLLTDFVWTADTNWHNWTFVADATSSACYLDGVSVATAGAMSATATTSLDINFGLQSDNATIFFPLEGSLAWPLFYNRRLAVGEVTELVAAPYSFLQPIVRRPYGPPTAAFIASLSDSVATSDSFTAAGIGSTSISDSVATSDSYTPSTFHPSVSVSDTVATSDTYRVIAASLSISDSVATSDAYTPSTFAPSASLTDTVATSDSYTPSIFAPTASVTDTVATSDAYTPSTFAPTASVSDSVATSDSLTPTFAPTASVTDTVATSDAYTVTAASLSIADTVATSDSFTGTGVATGSLSDTVATSDSYTGAGAATASISDTVATSDSFTSSPIGLALTDSVATSDSYTAATFAATASVSDTVATSDAYTPTFAPTVSTSDSVATSDSYTPSTFAPTASLSDTVVTSDSFTETGAFTATLSDTVATSDSFFIVSILVADTVATDDSYTVTGFTATAEIDDTLTVSDSFTVIPPATTATTVTGPSDGLWDADEQRRRWIEWSRQRKQRQDQKPVAKAKPADIRIEPQREISAAPAIAPAPQPVATDAIVQSLLQANAAAVRAQRESDAVIRANALALAEQLRIAQEEDDDDALALLMDD